MLDASTFQVTALAALSGLASALIGLRLGPFVEFHRKRPVMVAADLLRFAALGSVPLAAVLDSLTFTQLCVVAVVATASDITFTAASTAHLKWLVPPPLRLAANSRLEATMWTSSTVATPIGGVLVSWLGATVTIGLDAFSYLLSALGIRAIRTPEPESRERDRAGTGGLCHDRRLVLHPRPSRTSRAVLERDALRRLPHGREFLLALFMLRDLHLAAWQYGLAMGSAGAGGIVGALSAPGLTRWLGPKRVLLSFGVARTLWLGLLPLAPDGTVGLVFVTVSEFMLLFSAGVFNPAFSTYRMAATNDAYMSRVTMAWSMSAKTAQPIFIAVGGLLGRGDHTPDGAGRCRRCLAAQRALSAMAGAPTGVQPRTALSVTSSRLGRVNERSNADAGP